MKSIDRVKIASHFLIFKDCLNEIRHECNDSLFARTWLDTIADKDIRENRRQAYTEEWLKTQKDTIKDYLMDRKPVINNGEDYAVFYHEYLNTLDWVGESDGAISSRLFSADDRIRLTRAYLDLKQKKSYALMIMYYPIHNLWNFVKEKILENKFNIISEYELDFTGNKIGFESLIHDIYNDYGHAPSSLIERKINLLVKSKLIIKVVSIEELIETGSFYQRMGKLKMTLRDIMTFESDKNAFLNLHTPEDFEESEHLKHILVSVNNQWHIRNRLINPNELRFIEKINTVKTAIKKGLLDEYNYAVISTGVMEALGIWICNDIDLLPYHLIESIEGIDCFTGEYNKIEQSELKLSNQAIISDDNFYFYCYGMKFCNLDIVRQRCLYSYSLEASRQKVACIDSYYRFIDFVDDKKVLNKEIQIEFQRRRQEIRRERILPKRIICKLIRMVTEILSVDIMGRK